MVAVGWGKWYDINVYNKDDDVDINVNLIFEEGKWVIPESQGG